MHGKLISPHNVRTDHTVLRSNLKIHQVWWYDWELHAEGHAMARYSSRHWLQWPRTVTAFCTAFCIVILLRIAKFRLERVSSSVGFNCPQSARSDSWQWLAAKQHRHFTPCLSLTSSDHHIYKSYMHMGSCWQSQVSTSQHVVFLLFACPRAMYPADTLLKMSQKFHGCVFYHWRMSACFSHQNGSEHRDRFIFLLHQFAQGPSYALLTALCHAQLAPFTEMLVQPRTIPSFACAIVHMTRPKQNDGFTMCWHMFTRGSLMRYDKVC